MKRLFLVISSLLLTLPGFAHGTGKLQIHISRTEAPEKQLQIHKDTYLSQQRPILEPNRLALRSHNRNLVSDAYETLSSDNFASSVNGRNLVKRDATLGIRIGLANESHCIDSKMLSGTGPERILRADHAALSHSGIALFETVCFVVDQWNELKPSIRSCRVTSTNVPLLVEESLAIAVDVERSTGIEANSVVDGMELQGTASINQYEKLIRTVSYGATKAIDARCFKLVCEFYYTPQSSSNKDHTNTYKTNPMVVSVFPVNQHEDHPITSTKTAAPLDLVQKTAQHLEPENSEEDNTSVAWLVPVALVLLSVIVCIAVFTATRCQRTHPRTSGVDLNVLNQSQSNRFSPSSNEYYVRTSRSRLRSLAKFLGINLSRSPHSDSAHLVDSDAIQNEAEDETQDSNWRLA